DHAVVGEEGEGVDQDVDQIAVAVAPPEERHVHDLVGVLVDQFTAAVDQGVAKIFVDVVVVPNLHNDNPRVDSEPGSPAPYAVGALTSGRAHCPMPPRQSRVDGLAPIAGSPHIGGPARKWRTETAPNKRYVSAFEQATGPLEDRVHGDHDVPRGRAERDER